MLDLMLPELTVSCVAMLLCSAYFNSALSQPEYYEGYVIHNAESQVPEKCEPEKNPNYLEGVKRTSYEIILPDKKVVRKLNRSALSRVFSNL